MFCRIVAGYGAPFLWFPFAAQPRMLIHWVDPSSMKKIIVFLPLTVLCISSLAQSQPAVQPPGPAVPAGAPIPQWPALAVRGVEPRLPSVRSHDLEILHAKTALGGFLVRVSQQTIAAGSSPTLIGYVNQGELHWLNCANAPLQNQSVAPEPN